MDFWEGFLLGPLWSDTDYETHRHPGQLFGVGLVVWLFIALIVLLPNQAGFLISPRAMSLSLVLTVSLLLISPFICRIYYRCAFPVKLGILTLLTAKFAAAMLIPANLLLVGFDLNLSDLQNQALVYFDEYLGNMIDRFTAIYDGLGMIIGLIVGGLSLFGMGMGILVVSLIAPRLVVTAVKAAQWVYDSLLFRVVFRRVGFGDS